MAKETTTMHNPPVANERAEKAEATLAAIKEVGAKAGLAGMTALGVAEVLAVLMNTAQDRTKTMRIQAECAAATAEHNRIIAWNDARDATLDAADTILQRNDLPTWVIDRIREEAADLEMGAAE